MTCIIYDKRGFGKNEVERTGKVVVRQAQFLATGEACKVVFWPTPQNQFGKKEREGQKEKKKGGGGALLGVTHYSTVQTKLYQNVLLIFWKIALILFYTTWILEEQLEQKVVWW